MKLLLRMVSLLVIVAVVVLLVVAPWPLLLALLLGFAAWLQFARSGRQAGSITLVGLSTLGQRVGSSLVTVIGIAGVVAVLVAMLAMAQGYRDTLRGTGSSDAAIVMRGGSSAELASVFDRDSALVVTQAPGIALDAAGKPIASPELVVAVNLPQRGAKDADDLGSAQLRGVGEQAWALRSQVKIIAGRRFSNGLRELVAGTGARRQFAGLEPGRAVRIGNQDWQVVGIFESGDAMDSELWADAGVVGPAWRRGSSVSAVYVRLASAASFAPFKAALAGDPRLKVDVSTTADYYARQSESLTKTITVIGIVVGSIMAIGAVFGALNTMFATVAARAREIATLRAIGFRGTPVVVAVMIETLVLALAGGLLGGLVAWLVFNDYTASTMGNGMGQLTFRFHVEAALLWTGLKWALGMGFIGGLFPALRAARLPVAAALRAL
jgi:putative ABC transport system permease protein